MDNNLYTLIVGTSILLFSGYLFFPEKGLIAKWKRALLNNKRVKIEDALKHFYDCEYNNADCSLASISGSLTLPKDDAAKVIDTLQDMGLITNTGDRFILTSEGRSYALRVIRVHRLWERYLADETSVNETEWHSQAEEMEHMMSIEAANELAAQIGNPIMDPHGDPIPSTKGELPQKIGIPITQLNEGEFAKILHLEDEPSTVYAQLVAEGLYVGQQIRMIEKSSNRIKFEANGEIAILAPIIANNISVNLIPDSKNVVKSFKKLSDLSVGQKGTIVGIAKAVRGQQRRRLLDLGVVPGSEVKAEIQSLGGDPTGYRIRGATIAIRKKHASQVFIKDIISE